MPTLEELPEYDENDSSRQHSSLAVSLSGVDFSSKVSQKAMPTPSSLAPLPVIFTAESDAITTRVPVDARHTALPPLTTRETAVEAMKFCFLWFVANYFSNAALQYTNVPSFTIISAMSGFFTLFIGVSVGVEKFTWVKLGALIISYQSF